MRRICEAPEVWVADDFVTGEELRRIRAHARDEQAATDQGWVAAQDSASFIQEIPIEGAAALEALREAIEAQMGLENDLPWTFRYRRYGVGEGHPPHLDCYSVEGRALIATAMLYLCDTDTGGETAFPKVNLAVAPRARRLIVWYNHTPDGAPDPLSEHEGRPVREGEKEILVWLVYKYVEAAGVRMGARLA